MFVMDIVQYVLKYEPDGLCAKANVDVLYNIFMTYCALPKGMVLCRKYHYDTLYRVTHIEYDGEVMKIEDDHFYTSIHPAGYEMYVNYEFVIIREIDYQNSRG